MMGGINDLVLGIQPKLIDCCRWRDLENCNNEHLPQNVCISCVQKLEQCWEFAESVSAAQQELLRMVDDIKLDSFEGDLSMKIDTIHCDDDMFECDIKLDPSLEHIHYEKEICTIELPSVNGNASVAEEPTIKHLAIQTYNKDKFSLRINRDPSKNVNEDIECHAIPLIPKSEQRKGKGPKIKKVNSKRQIKKNAKETAKQTMHQKLKKFAQKEPKEYTALKYKEFPLPERQSKSTKPDDTFLALIRNEDRNDDGTIEPDRIGQLKLSSWLMLQYQCYLCGTCSGEYYTLRHHVSEEHPGSPFKLLCSFCKKKEPRTLTRKQAMIDHTKIFHFPHLKYCCWKCNKFYWDIKKLREHVSGHKHLPNLKELVGVLCHQCGKTCRDDSHFRQHSFSHIPGPAKPSFECYMCGKRYTSKLALDYHMFDHFGGEKHKCETCHLEFKRKDALKRHIRIHSKDFPFPCLDCDKRFKTKKSVDTNININQKMASEENRGFALNQSKKAKLGRFKTFMRMVESGDIDAVKAMLGEVCLADKVNELGESPLHIAVKKNDLEMVKCLLTVCPMIINNRTKAYRSALHMAVANNSEEIVKFLIDRGASLENLDIMKRTPLFNAVAEGHANLVKLLLDKGADSSVVDKNGYDMMLCTDSDIISDMLCEYRDKAIERTFNENLTSFIQSNLVSNEPKPSTSSANRPEVERRNGVPKRCAMSNDDTSDVLESFALEPTTIIVRGVDSHPSTNRLPFRQKMPKLVAAPVSLLRVNKADTASTERANSSSGNGADSLFTKLLGLQAEKHRIQEESIRNQAQIDLLMDILRQQQTCADALLAKLKGLQGEKLRIQEKRVRNQAQIDLLTDILQPADD
ncbi:uncharacterized protein LOC129575078 isoform X2 [Sitodiplosis mosellana]|nr:uncharacterized protein LOC129575078 isoform X2 [Sitodiplosis mosellana]